MLNKIITAIGQIILLAEATALAFLMGAEKGLFALVIGMLLAVVTMATYNKANNKDQKASFPLVPFLWIGASLAYMI